MRIFVGNLKFTATNNELEAFLCEQGFQPMFVNVIADHATGRSKGFGFVEIPDSEECSTDEVIAALNGLNFQGRDLRVDRATPRPERPRYSDN